MNKYSNFFNQILQKIGRYEFEGLVKKFLAEKHAKGFGCWDQFVSMMFLHFGRMNSLSEICNGLATCVGKLVHVGLTKAPSKSTLAYANEHRPWELYQAVFYHFLDKFRNDFSLKHKFRFKNSLLSFDASLFELCKDMFDWAKFRRKKGAAKIHLVLDHDGYLPTFCNITDGKTHELNVLKSLCFQPGTIVVFDRGCIDYRLFAEWTEDGVFFVTREKANMDFKVVGKNPVKGKNVLKDEIIELKGFYTSRKCPYPLRRVQIYDEKTKEKITFITNNFKFSASTVAAIYKDRWQIEIFFKTLKQRLRVKTFVGTSANALKIQIWTALIAILVLKYMQFKSRAGLSMSNLAALLRLNLFSYRDLWEWLNDPLGNPPLEPTIQEIQGVLFGQHNDRPGFSHA